jgi:hypothetical protein
MRRLLLGFFVTACTTSPNLYVPTIPVERTSSQGDSFVPSGYPEENAPQDRAAPTKTAGPKAPSPVVLTSPKVLENPIKKQMKKGQVFYRLDDRINGTLSCDKWTLDPTSTADPTVGTLTFQYQLTDRTVVFTYDYKVTYDFIWKLEINGKENGKVEKIKGGVNYIQTLKCQETFDLGLLRKTDFDIGKGVWYLNKASCEKARKAASTKSPGSC